MEEYKPEVQGAPNSFRGGSVNGSEKYYISYSIVKVDHIEQTKCVWFG